MTFDRNTPWIHFKETGELVCKRCGECEVPIAQSFTEIKIAGDRFKLKHKACKAKVPVKRGAP